MKTKKIFKISLFIILSGLLLLSFSGCVKAENINTSLEVDEFYDVKLASINKILERNEEYQRIEAKIKRIKFDSYSYTLNIFCDENNDVQLMNARNKRIAEVIRKYGSL